ncbi:hypothetical protein TNCV_2767181 [Trichonephila clavipes]|nr:hypothetical protein TNCV_2767181 [Trichonephila clavipes]
MTPKWLPTWLYRQDFSKFSLNRHYKGLDEFQELKKNFIIFLQHPYACSSYGVQTTLYNRTKSVDPCSVFEPERTPKAQRWRILRLLCISHSKQLNLLKTVSIMNSFLL